MPYIIVVCVLVILGISSPFLKQKTETLLSNTSPEQALPLSQATTSPQLTETTIESDDDDSDNEKSEEKDDYDDNPSPSDVLEQTPPQTSTQTSIAPVSTNTYTNGTYAASQTYRTPEGTYTMNVKVSVADDTVSGVTVQFDSEGARDGYSRKFSSAYQSTVLGKDLEAVHLSRIGGASLTTTAFNKALDSIRSQAS
ncbi:MAG: hypothetical protein RL538_395 [Candidatus Parcubacteria bacterium]|jgi:cytoskeletal protein RodZ